MKNHPTYLTERAYEWCSVICENLENLAHGQYLLFLSLEIGFCHLNPKHPLWGNPLTHTEHHLRLADIIFESGDNEALADLLTAWNLLYPNPNSDGPLNGCVGHFEILKELQSLSPRLQQAILRSIEVIGYEEFDVGMEIFIALLNNLHIGVEDWHWSISWINILLDVIQSSEATQHLSHHYWELLVELILLHSKLLDCYLFTYDPQVMTSLMDAQEWDKLECWMGVVWMIWPPGFGGTTVEGLEHGMLLLFHKWPGAIQKLQQWMEQLNDEWGLRSEPFKQICEIASLGRTQHDTQ